MATIGKCDIRVMNGGFLSVPVEKVQRGGACELLEGSEIQMAGAAVAAMQYQNRQYSFQDDLLLHITETESETVYLV